MTCNLYKCDSNSISNTENTLTRIEKLLIEHHQVKNNLYLWLQSPDSVLLSEEHRKFLTSLTV